MRSGLLYAVVAFTTWGLFPLYLQLVRDVPPLEVVLHRSTWALVLLLAVLAWQRRWQWLRKAACEPRQLARFGASAALLSVNWLVYVYAAHSGHVMQASLGYFINPLVSVLLGVVVLRERLRPLQWAAVALAAAGVAWLTWRVGSVPWVALALAASFGVYGLLRKTATLGALEGLTLENLLLAAPVLLLLGWWAAQGQGVLALQRPDDATRLAWLMLGGPLTALPLLTFAAAARRLPLATLGMVQYLSPTIQLVLAVTYFGEPFDAGRLAGFGFIWAALALLSVDALRPRAAAPEAASPPLPGPGAPALAAPAGAGTAATAALTASPRTPAPGAPCRDSPTA